MITIKVDGTHQKTMNYLKSLSKLEYMGVLDHYGNLGVNALASATPIDSGLTALAWSYKIVKSEGNYSIVWSNTNVNDGVNIAIIIQYGHATRSGSWVQGRDYINPAIQPIFDEISTEVWRKVTSG